MNLKPFGKDIAIYAIGHTGTRMASFFVIPLYTYGLSVDNYGQLATLLLTIQILMMLMDMGSRKAFIRFAGEYKQKNRLGQLLTCSILVNVLGGLVVSCIVIIWLPPLFRQVLHTQEVVTVMVLTCITGMTQSLYTNVMSYYQTNNESIKFVLTSIAVPALLIVLSAWLLLVLDAGLEGALVAQIISHGGIALLVTLDFCAHDRIQTSLTVMRKLFQFGFPLSFVMSGDLITEASGVYFLSRYAGLEQVAVFSLGNKIAQIAQMLLILPFQLVYEPFVYSNIKSSGIQAAIGRLLTYLMLGFAMIAFAIVFVFRDLFPFVAPESYSAAYPIIFLILPSIAFRGVYYVGESLLHIQQLTNVTLTCVLIFTVLRVGLNYLLVPRFGMYGAIAVLNGGSMALAVLVLVLGMKAFPIRLEGYRLAITATVCLALLTAVFLVHESRAYVFYTVGLIALCGCAVFLFTVGFFDVREQLAMRSVIHEFGLVLRRWGHA